MPYRNETAGELPRTQALFMLRDDLLLTSHQARAK